ncbi:endo-1,4-beta-xylanase [Streptomyces sp. NPDC059499]|uniref:endo-1,4-beta-xylanase n=1 Tax=Streptomyces sp. NPDC059499 TaxID=3346852 RepID=UPI0036BD417B
MLKATRSVAAAVAILVSAFTLPKASAATDNAASRHGRGPHADPQTLAVPEADVRMPLPADSTRLEARAEGHAVLLRGCLPTPRCNTFTVWGFSDTYSWVPRTFPGDGAANILDEKNTAKPAYGTLRQTLTLAAGRHWTHTC